jgi:aspartate racemase
MLARMRTIGVLGGMSSVASGEYYRLLNEGVNARLGGHSAAEIVMYSVDFAVMERFIRDRAWDEAGEYLAVRAAAVEHGGADLLLLATNTFHRVAPQIEAAVAIPFVHIVDVTADAVRADGASTVGLLGTAPVMQADFYRDRFAGLGISVLVPPAADQEVVHRIIFDELTRGEVSATSRMEYVRIMVDLVSRGAQGIVLGCTEISLLVGPDDLPGTPLYDTTALHVARAVELALAG